MGAETLYMTVKGAAEYAGIGEGAMREYVDSADPPPMLMVGARRYIQRKGLAQYLEERQTWHYSHGQPSSTSRACEQQEDRRWA